jgi:limonene-1,2-epoxide hydrolase
MPLAPSGFRRSAGWRGGSGDTSVTLGHPLREGLYEKGRHVPTTQAEQLIDKLMSTWHRGDIDEMLDFFADDAVYHNMPMAPPEGKPAIRELLSQFLGAMEGLEVEVHRQVANGNIVMHERTDHFSLGQRQMSLPICGVFEVDNGRIKAWREYFDMAAFSE